MSSTEWPSGSQNNSWPEEPKSLLPGRVEGYPAGTQKAANKAEQLLSQAVGWWDVSQYRDGDRFLRNRGTAGELLNLRLGSSIVANSNDPLYLAPADQGYVYLPGVTNNRLEVPNSTSLNLTGDMEFVFRCSMSAAGLGTFVDKAENGGSVSTTTQYCVYTSAGQIQLWSSNKGFLSDAWTGVNPPNEVRWWKITLVLDNGSGNAEARFYGAPDSDTEPVSWTQIGSAKTSAGVATPVANTQNVSVGAVTGNGGFAATSVMQRAIIRSGIDGTTVLDIDCDAITSGSATSFTALTGQTVSINRDTSGRKSVAMPSRHKGGRPVMLLGTDDFLQVPDENIWQHQALAPRSGTSITLLIVGRYWPTPKAVGEMMAALDMEWQQGANNHGMMIQPTGTSHIEFAMYGTKSAVRNILNHQYGSVNVLVSRIDRNAQLMTAWRNGSSTAALSIADAGIVNSGVRRVSSYIGRELLGYYCNFEFYSAAIFRRALSLTEIQLITDYYTEKQSPYYLPTKAQQKTYLADQLDLNETTDSAVLDVLSDATFYVDSSVAIPGERYAKNLGINRDTLNARYGSAQTTNSNDPLLLKPESRGYVYMPGVAGNYLSVPDAADVSITGDIDIRAKVNLTTWTPATGSSYVFVSKWNNAPQNSYMLYLLDAADGNKLRMLVSSTGSDGYSATSSVAPGFSPGTTAWVRATYATASGEVKFYTSTDDAATWTQLGTTQTTTAVAIYDGTQRVEIGSYQGQSAPLVGRVYRAQILNGINGPTVLDIDCDAITSGSATSFTASTGQTVTINRSTAGRKIVAMPSVTEGGSPAWLLGSDDYFEVDSPLQHEWLNFDAGQSFTVLAVLRTWANQTDARQIITKRNATSGVGWRLDTQGVQSGTQAEYRSIIRSDANTSASSWARVNFGAVAAVGMSVDRAATSSQFFALTSGQSPSTPGYATSSVSSVANQDPTTIGMLSASGTLYLDMEFYAAVIFRRALSASEITTLSNYFTGRIS